MYQLTSVFFMYVQADESVIKTVVAALTTEEQAIGLELPPGVGQRPWMLQVDCYPTGKITVCLYFVASALLFFNYVLPN